MEIIEVSGDSNQVGRQLGEHFRREIKQVTEYARNDLYKISDRSFQELKYGVWHDFAPFVSFNFQEGWKQLIGMSASSGISLNELLAFSLEDELFPGFSEKCTSVAAKLANGDIVLAHNEDWDSHYGLAMIKGDLDGTRFLSTSYIGKLIGNGATLNEHGFAFAGNSLYFDESPIIGAPKEFLLASLIDTKDSEDFMHRVCQYKHAGFHNVTFASSWGKMGYAEIMQGRIALSNDDSFATHTNHSRNKLGVGKEIRKDNSVKRLEAALSVEGRPLAESDIKALMACHNADGIFSICRHNGDVKNEYHIRTLASSIINTTTLEIHAADGNPCQSDFVRYKL
jgi:isopenicillin-N N-acyltransferase-like protein